MAVGYNYNGELGRGFASGSPYYEQPFGLVDGFCRRFEE